MNEAQIECRLATQRRWQVAAYSRWSMSDGTRSVLTGVLREVCERRRGRKGCKTKRSERVTRTKYARQPVKKNTYKIKTKDRRSIGRYEKRTTVWRELQPASLVVWRTPEPGRATVRPRPSGLATDHSSSTAWDGQLDRSCQLGSEHAYVQL